MDIAGEMLATSNCGFVFPIFAPFVYQYIQTATLESTQHLLQLDDITNFDLLYVCEMVVIFLVFSNMILWQWQKILIFVPLRFWLVFVMTRICPTLDVA